ncbi:S-phase kinase-associated protein 2 isoform X2 [Nilaparvata lugens]|uniref:S-phase kinase-associated protein 2 isoform X3 n=3 Tax=Nilaparvata lugens TaxID=108931 RepID=UPI00193CD031|nr:S-phase kinase-associated protein 2 isoform X3 [Nilaparvata lugens]XP_039295950.1 S-phase kinase-associated protein 2 isoform X2 [Nilaparvata lugens]
MRRSKDALLSEEESSSKMQSKNNNNKRCKISNDESDLVTNGFKDENVDVSNVVTNGRHADEEIKSKSMENLVTNGRHDPEEIKLKSMEKIESKEELKCDLPVETEVKVESKTQVDDCTNFLRRRKKSSTSKRRSQEGPNHFTKISDEMILQIFQFLPKKSIADCASVCKRWRDVAYDESLWTRLDLSGRAFQTDTLAYIISRNSRIVKMPTVEICSPIFAECVDMVTSFWWRVEYLDLSMAVVNPADLAVLLSKCRDLRKLSLEHCCADRSVCESVAQNEKLDTLNMVMCYMVSCEGLTEIMKYCKRLRELNLGWTELEGDSVEAVCSLVNPDITHLDISGCKALKDEQALKLVDRCRSLVYLDVSDCVAITEQTFNVIIENLDKLQQLSVSRCYKITPSLYPNLEAMPELTNFNVFGLLNDKQIEMLQKCLSKMSINKTKFSTIARPTVGIRRTSIWGLKTRDSVA